MKHTSAVLLAMLVYVTAGFASAQTRNESPFGESYTKIFARPFFASAILSIHRPSWQKSFPLWIYFGGRGRSMVRVGGPARGQGLVLLSRDKRVYLYFPGADLRLDLPSMMGSFPLFGSDFCADDFFAFADLSAKFIVQSDGEESLSGVETKRYRLVPRARDTTLYAAARLWVSRSRGLPLRQEFISERGQVAREVVMEEDGALPFPSRWHATTFTAGSGSSELAFRVFERNPPVSADLYTVEGLRRWR